MLPSYSGLLKSVFYYTHVTSLFTQSVSRNGRQRALTDIPLFRESMSKTLTIMNFIILLLFDIFKEGAGVSPPPPLVRRHASHLTNLLFIARRKLSLSTGPEKRHLPEKNKASVL